MMPDDGASLLHAISCVTQEDPTLKGSGMPTLPLLHAAALAAGLTALAPAQANLLINGSFEQPAGVAYEIVMGRSGRISGWTTVDHGVEWFNASSYGGAANGVMVVDLANYIYTGGGIEQSFATQAGRTYELDFSLGTTAGSGRDGTAHFDVTVAGTTHGYDIRNPLGTLVWTAEHLSFTAQAASTTLRFANGQNPYLHFADVDGVSVTPTLSAVPEPGSASLSLAALGALALVGRRRQRART
jgi:hypothetical protein